jgi:vacuolar-type H+-ATPase subunit F/Vma7
MSLGPVEYALIKFPGNRFTGEIAPALGDLVASGTVRIIDLIFIAKDADGTVEAFELSDLEEETAAAFHSAGVEVGELLTPEDAEEAGEALEPESSAAIIVWENAWARALVEGIRNADGVLVAHERIPGPVVEAALAAAAE